MSRCDGARDAEDTRSPCVKVCRFEGVGDGGICAGCFRTRSEARSWKDLSAPEKAAINWRVRPLMTPGKPKSAGRKKLRKLDKRIRKLEKKLERLKAERLALALDGPVRWDRM